jgi:hypothetical protein
LVVGKYQIYKGLFNMKKIVLVSLLFIIFGLQMACASAKEGVYQVQTTKGMVTGVITPSDGWVLSGFTNEEYDYHIRMFQYTTKVRGGTSDNAGVTLDVSLSLEPPKDFAGVKLFCQEFGLIEDERWQRMTSFLATQLSSEGKKAIIKHEAYVLLANQSKVENDIKIALEPIYASKGISLKFVTILNRPDFDDDRIENAASAVVANGKLREAAEAALSAEKVEVERKQLQAQSFNNPNLLKLEELRIQKEMKVIEREGFQAIADGIKNHQGSLTLIMGQQPNTQLQLQDKK